MTRHSTIWKFPVSEDVQILELPKDAWVLTVQDQDGVPCIWAAVDPDAPKVLRKVFVVCTGQLLPFSGGGAEYVGTFQRPPHAWHVFLGAANG